MENIGFHKCKINEVITYNSDDQRPALINFEEGVLLKETDSEFKCKLIEDYEDESDKEESGTYRRKTMLLKRDHDEIFVGKKEAHEMIPTACGMMIVIRNKETNKLTLIETDQYNVLKVLNTEDDADKESSSDEDESIFETDRQRLYKSFGSKRSLRNLDLSIKSKVNTEAMKNQMQNTASKITINTEDLELKEGNVDIYLPKCNRKAISPGEVYNLEDMLSKEELESLNEVTERVLSDPPTESPEGSEFSPFFVSALKYVGKNRTPTQIKCLLYADAILYFLKLRMSNLKNKKVTIALCPFSKLVSEKIIEEFTSKTENGRIRPEELVDKAVCWIIVLTVLACKFTLDTALVCPHLLNRQLDIRRFEKMLKVVGLSSLNAGFWALRTPLPELLITKVNLLQNKKYKR